MEKERKNQYKENHINKTEYFFNVSLIKTSLMFLMVTLDKGIIKGD